MIYDLLNSFELLLNNGESSSYYYYSTLSYVFSNKVYGLFYTIYY